MNFQSYLSPCLTGITSGEDYVIDIFQSYLSPCLTNPQISISIYEYFLSILPQSVFNSSEKASQQTRAKLSILPQSVFNSDVKDKLNIPDDLSILPQSVFNNREQHICLAAKVFFQSYLSPCLTRRLTRRMHGFRFFQSYLSPCLTLLFRSRSNPSCSFQSYLSPCLTGKDRGGVCDGKFFQSYLSPCLTAGKGAAQRSASYALSILPQSVFNALSLYPNGSMCPRTFNPTLVRV